MIDLNAVEFKKIEKGDGWTAIRASLVLEAEMTIAPGLGEQRPEFEARTRDVLSRVIEDQIYGDIKEYMHLMRTYMRLIAPDPRFHSDHELQKRIEDLEDKFNMIFR